MDILLQPKSSARIRMKLGDVEACDELASKTSRMRPTTF
ncbi:MAG: hypothetical protein ACJA2O_004622, partial [Candidatus Azotimanducaceae bacterium]